MHRPVGSGRAGIWARGAFRVKLMYGRPWSRHWAEMFAYYQQEGHTLRGLAKHLRELGVRGPRGSSHWSDGTIHHILTNPVYTGTVYAGRNHYRPATGRISPLKPVGGGNGSIERVPTEDWIVVAHIPAIARGEQFDMIQEKLKHNQSIASRNNKKHLHLLRFKALLAPFADPQTLFVPFV